MKTNNIEGLTIFEINLLIQQGGKFIKFPYMKKFKSSNIYFVRPEEKAFKYALKYFLSNLKIEWRQFPLAPVHIIKSLFYLAVGGRDYTHAMLSDLRQNNPVYTPNIHYLQYA